jgi:hypothetical protein
MGGIMARLHSQGSSHSITKQQALFVIAELVDLGRSKVTFGVRAVTEVVSIPLTLVLIYTSDMTSVNLAQHQSKLYKSPNCFDMHVSIHCKPISLL